MRHRSVGYPSLLAALLFIGGSGPAPAAAQDTAGNAPSFQPFSKFDFVPGEKIIAVEDFLQESIGDFPAKWNNAAGEIVTISGSQSAG